MKKIINNKVYDTETAKELGSWDNGRYGNDFGAMSETLYRKKTGEYFIHGDGGAMTKYAQATGQNEWSGGSRIMPMTFEEARQWAEEHLDAGKYEEIFGEVTEDDSRVKVGYFLAVSTVETIKRRAAELGITASAYLDQLISQQ